MFAGELPSSGSSEQLRPMPFTFDAGEGRAGNLCRERATPLFGNEPIRVVKNDKRRLVPRSQIVLRSLLSEGVRTIYGKRLRALIRSSATARDSRELSE